MERIHYFDTSKKKGIFIGGGDDVGHVAGGRPLRIFPSLIIKKWMHAIKNISLENQKEAALSVPDLSSHGFCVMDFVGSIDKRRRLSTILIE